MSQIYIDGRDRVMYYGNTAGFVKDSTATCDVMFRTDELSAFLEKHGYSSVWLEGVYERLLCGESIAAEEAVSGLFLKRVRILKLKPASPIWSILATPGKALPEPLLSDYAAAYDGGPGSNDPEQLCERFSLSLTDIVELYDDESSTYYYLDRTCFRQVQF